MNHLKLRAVPSANSLKPLKTVLTVLSVLLNRNLTKCTEFDVDLRYQKW